MYRKSGQMQWSGVLLVVSKSMGVMAKELRHQETIGQLFHISLEHKTSFARLSLPLKPRPLPPDS